MSVLPQNKHRPHIEQKIYLKEKSTSIFIEPLFSCEKGLKNSSKHRFVQEQYKTFFFKKEAAIVHRLCVFLYIWNTTSCNYFLQPLYLYDKKSIGETKTGSDLKKICMDPPESKYPPKLLIISLSAMPALKKVRKFAIKLHSPIQFLRAGIIFKRSLAKCPESI